MIRIISMLLHIIDVKIIATSVYSSAALFKDHPWGSLRPAAGSQCVSSRYALSK